MSTTAKVEAAEVLAWTINGIVVEGAEKVWMCNKAPGVIVPKPTLVPLSKIKELAVVEAPVYLTKKLLVPEPLSLLLKVVQSVFCNWPVLLMEAKGKFRVKELVVVEMLKILPAVPVEILVMTLPDKLMEVEVPIKTCWPPVMDRPLPTVKLPKVVVPIPPLLTGMTPVIAMVEVPEMAMLVEPVNSEPMSE